MDDYCFSQGWTFLSKVVESNQNQIELIGPSSGPLLNGTIVGPFIENQSVPIEISALP